MNLAETERMTHSKRVRISNDNLHISSFVIVKPEGEDDSILLLRAGESHPLAFRRGKLLLPSSMLNFGEHPRDAAKRILNDQIKNSKDLDLQFLDMQSYLGAHWDLCFVYKAENASRDLEPREPFTQASFYEMSDLPRSEIAGDHLEVLEALTKITQ